MVLPVDKIFIEIETFFILFTVLYFIATITKMSAPNSNASSGAVSNVTVSLARPVITSHSAVAIVPGVGTAGSSLVTQSPSKLVAPMIARPTTHRVAGAITGIVAGGNSAGSTSVVSLASVTVQGLQQSQVRTFHFHGTCSVM